ncbi:hypothetical protein OJ996_11935 [Luteolibacter sp. GHJ8]|uniref:Uncharacterized protein n=1 Tax=Luteolibacter rhizosphaerae TaxID=2989719 RepID=A0ABT3G368_9BACT|nr:hypothetical protein [Luteolibacter rhizosphaerae]MCW1914290.1 hypothetical protein [Luteolibacter rhizosphaerae]
MNGSELPVCYYINNARAQHLRSLIEWDFAQNDLDVIRFAGVDPDRRWRSFSGVRRGGVRSMSKASLDTYVILIAMIIIIRNARSQRLNAVAIFRDNVTLRANFKRLLSRLALPEDWGVLLLDGNHNKCILPVCFGLAKIEDPLQGVPLAFMVSRRHFNVVLADLKRLCKMIRIDGLEALSGAFQTSRPIFTCVPALVWKREPDFPQSSQSCKRIQLEVGEGSEDIFTKMYGGGVKGIRSKLALIFLTRADVNHPSIWRDFVDECPERVVVHSHSKVRSLGVDAFLHGTIVDSNILTKWGDMSWSGRLGFFCPRRFAILR